MAPENRSTWRFSHLQALDVGTGVEIVRRKSYFGLWGFTAAA